MAERRTKEFHEYILRLWEMVKQKVSKISKKHGFDKFVNDVQKFFSEDVSDFFKGIGKKFNDIKF
jgi:isoleucyl-tRNA synthetase